MAQANPRNVATAAGADLIVDRITTALAAARKERDDLHRRKELSCERLRLVREGFENQEKTVRGMQEKLAELKESGNVQQEINDLKQQVQYLTKEAAFQHAELIGKREKVAKLEASMKEDAQSRASAKEKVSTKLGKMREDLSARQVYAAKFVPVSTQMELIKIEMEELNSERLWNSWPRIIEQRAAALTKKAKHMQRSRLRSVLAKYQYLVGESGEAATNDSDAMMMDA